MSISESQNWDPFTEGQINVLQRVQMKVAQFTNKTKDSDWENLTGSRTITCLCTIFQSILWGMGLATYMQQVEKQYYLSRVGHDHLKRKKQNITLGGQHVYSRL